MLNIYHEKNVVLTGKEIMSKATAAGVVSGANIGAVLASGRPIACQMHSLTDIDATANLILEYLVAANLVGDERASLEIAAVGAFTWAYPCGVEL